MTDDARHAIETASAAALERIAQLTRDIGRVVEATADANTDDEHDPEGATIAFERAQALSLREQATARLADLDAALARLDAGTYGRCETCGEPIAAGRLTARPAARTCIRCATSG
jgi:DnaK suppressor protein